jgi:hypothetical protein
MPNGARQYNSLSQAGIYQLVPGPLVRYAAAKTNE